MCIKNRIIVILNGVGLKYLADLQEILIVY